MRDVGAQVRVLAKGDYYGRTGVVLARVSETEIFQGLYRVQMRTGRKKTAVGCFWGEDLEVIE